MSVIAACFETRDVIGQYDQLLLSITRLLQPGGAMENNSNNFNPSKLIQWISVSSNWLTGCHTLETQIKHFYCAECTAMLEKYRASLTRYLKRRETLTSNNNHRLCAIQTDPAWNIEPPEIYDVSVVIADLLGLTSEGEFLSGELMDSELHIRLSKRVHAKMADIPQN